MDIDDIFLADNLSKDGPVVKTEKEIRTLPKINTTYCVPKAVKYNSNPCGIYLPVVLSLTSVHPL
ncbi:MAG: hypothetical protein LBK08_03530, partial [Treponema sp.]|nr:hypothetical protein [Treponema sp.]